jgi:hypothetical protein
MVIEWLGQASWAIESPEKNVKLASNSIAVIVCLIVLI